MQIRRRDASKQTRNLSRAQDVEMPARLTIRACAAGEARLMKQGWPEFGMLTISGKTQPAPGPGVEFVQKPFRPGACRSNSEP
jgi:hypothetical protein